LLLLIITTHAPKVVNDPQRLGGVRHGEVVAAGDDVPLGDAVGAAAAQQRQGVGLVGDGVDDLVGLGEDDAHRLLGPGRLVPGARPPRGRQRAPRRLLAHHGRHANAAHEGGHEAVVVVEHPADVGRDAQRQRRAGRAVARVVDLGRRQLDGVRRGAARRGVGRGCGGGAGAGDLGAAGDGLAQAAARQGGQQALGHEAAGEDEPGQAAEALGADEAGGGEKDEGADGGRQGGGQVDGDAAAHAVADDVAGVGAGPGQRRRGHGQERLGRVEAGVVRQVADTVREAAAEKVEEKDAAAAGGQGRGQRVQRVAGRRDAVQEEDLAAGGGAELVDADGAVLRRGAGVSFEEVSRRAGGERRGDAYGRCDVARAGEGVGRVVEARDLGGRQLGQHRLERVGDDARVLGIQRPAEEGEQRDRRDGRRGDGERAAAGGPGSEAGREGHGEQTRAGRAAGG